MTQTFPSTALAELSEAHYRRHHGEIHVRFDRMFAWVMAIQYVLAVVLSMVTTPRTYAGSWSTVHPHVWTAVLLGGVLAAYPVYLATHRPGEAYTRYAIAVAQALFSALLIHLTGGRIETHFHIFGSLAFLAMYRDWRVLILNSAVVALDHVARGLWFPVSIYGTDLHAQWRFVEHAGWVVFEDAFLLVAYATTIREMRATATRQAELELAKGDLERTAVEVGRKSAILNSVLEGMHDGVVVADLDGRHLHFNPAAETILGHAAEACCDDTLDTLPLGRAIGGESVYGEQTTTRHGKTGQDVWLEVSAEPLTGLEGGRIGGVTVFRDVTERRRILEDMELAREESERANRAKSEFLSRMSHELRTPMNAILGFGQLLRMDALTEDQDDSVDQILRAGAHLLQLINEVLDLSGIEAGKLSISKEPVDVKELAREVASMVQPLAAAANVTLRTPDPSEDEAFALADHQRLRQVLLNLVSNAIKYNVAGGSATLEVEEADGRLRIMVRDTGPGIPAEMHDRLFNPFERLGAQNTSVEGTGLGLALTKRLTEAMGGTICLESSGAGSCFFVELPSVESPLCILERDEPEVEAERHATGSATILLIEDNPANVRLVERIMKARPNHRLLVAQTGAHGLDLAERHLPDLVLLDLDLPDIGGGDVLRLLREDARLDAAPIVIVSADASASSVDRLLASGATAFVTKPYEVKGLLTLIDGCACGPELATAA